MELLDLARRAPPAPWVDGDNIPWHEPDFSERMLREHLSQAHDFASRRFESIDAHVQWIDRSLLHSQPSRLLDLGCGPGLYTSRLARLGHRCTGIDYAPASIAHARAEVARDGLRCDYVEGDLREVEWSGGFDLVMMIFGELNVFRPDDAADLLHKARAALVAGGTLLLEVHSFDAVRRQGDRGAGWSAQQSGLFADRPHLLLTEHAWDEATRTTTRRYHVVDAETATVQRHAGTLQAYDDGAYRSLLAQAGFAAVELLGSLAGEAHRPSDDLVAITARRR